MGARAKQDYRPFDDDVFGWQISLNLYLISRFAEDWRPVGALMRNVAPSPSPPRPSSL